MTTLTALPLRKPHPHEAIGKFMELYRAFQFDDVFTFRAITTPTPGNQRMYAEAYVQTKAGVKPERMFQLRSTGGDFPRAGEEVRVSLLNPPRDRVSGHVFVPPERAFELYVDWAEVVMREPARRRT